MRHAKSGSGPVGMHTNARYSLYPLLPPFLRPAETAHRHALRPAEPEIDPDSTESSSDSEDANGDIVEPDPDTETRRQQFCTARIDRGPSVVGGKIMSPELSVLACSTFTSPLLTRFALQKPKLWSIDEAETILIGPINLPYNPDVDSRLSTVSSLGCVPGLWFVPHLFNPDIGLRLTTEVSFYLDVSFQFFLGQFRC
ncbi:hypothetical protein B0H14DRAFT_2567443 [Mycena olivaceomarginata]|nr:hypothetical protein B0H14DRAFT_2567443 [Mycena olivaceomarginata]